jgi:FAD/FMN-containing dehydrogenase
MDTEAVQQLRATFRGEVIGPDDPGYEQARKVFNGMVDKRPALIARVRGVADVVAAVKFARGQNLPIAIRGGGHSVAGHGTCDGGLLIDLRDLRGVHVDPEAQTVTAQGGCNLGDLDNEAQLHGLVVPSGQVTATGIAGLTLSGGMGMLQRKYGLTCDNLISAEVVTADGELVIASEASHPELFWALRGGGGNFGVVTSFTYRAHKVGPMMVSGLVAYPVEKSPEVLAFLRDYIADAPEEMSADAIFQFAPPLEVIPEEYRGRQVIGIFIRWCGEVEAGLAEARKIQEFGEPVLNFVYPMPLVMVQSMLDPLNPDGNLHYWTGEFIPEFDSKSIEVVARVGAALPTRHTIIQVIPFNAAVTRVPADATAFAHRDESWLIHILGQWHEPEETERCRGWVKQSAAALREVGSGDVYLNLVTDDEETDRVRAFWNDQRLQRLERVKAAYDPDNVFCFNHNIKPGTPDESRPGAPDESRSDSVGSKPAAGGA